MLFCVCREDGSESGETYMSSPSLLWVTEDGNLAIGDMPNVGGYRGRRAPLQPKHTLSLALSESVLEVHNQGPLPPPFPPVPVVPSTHIVPGAFGVCFLEDQPLLPHSPSKPKDKLPWRCLSVL